jgi:hypothetical protein
MTALAVSSESTDPMRFAGMQGASKAHPIKGSSSDQSAILTVLFCTDIPGFPHKKIVSRAFRDVRSGVLSSYRKSNLPAGERRQGLSQEIGNEDHEKRLGTWATGDRDREALTDRVIAAEMRRSGLRFVETQGIGIARL